MEQSVQQNVGWPDNTGESSWDSTAEPAAGISVSMIEEAVPASLTVAAVAAVTVVVIIAIVIVFVLGVFIDCRQQRILAEKMDHAKRQRNPRKASAHPDDGDAAGIVANMEEPDRSPAPAESLRNIP